MLKNFIKCGALGWCMEILWTGLRSLMSGDLTMMGKTSLLMLPIYGCAAFVEPLYPKIAQLPAGLRGYLYVAAAFLIEFTSGTFLSLFSMCPWDYTGTALSVGGVIRLDYAPLWFLAGLFYENILVHRKS